MFDRLQRRNNSHGQIFISPEWYIRQKTNENNNLTNLTINRNSQRIQHDEVAYRKLVKLYSMYMYVDYVFKLH